MLLLAACAAEPADAARAGWIVNVLARDNEIWLDRDPALLAGKLARMAADPYDFYRGSAALSYADATRPDPDRAPSSFGVTPETAAILLAGDPHPENVGTLASDGVNLRFELVDLDGAGFGAYVLDTRRAAGGIALFAGAVPGCDDACVDAAVTSFSSAYATLDEDAQRCETLDAGEAVDDLCDPPSDPLVDEQTRDGRFLLDGAVDEAGKGLLACTQVERAQVQRLWEAWDARPGDLVLLDAARRYGVGVASYPAVRYGLLVEDGSGARSLLNLREVVDPPSASGRRSAIPALFDDNAARVEGSAAALWSDPHADPWLAGLDDGGVTFKLTSWSERFDGFAHEAVPDPAALRGLAAVVGRVLGGAHARGWTADGEPAGPALRADLAGREDEFVEERLRDARADAARALVDTELFGAALDELGPRLGLDALPTDTP